LGREKELQDLSLKELKEFAKAFEEDVFDVLKLEQMVNRRTSQGGTAKENVIMAVKDAEERLKLEAAECESQGQDAKKPR
jgi:argininosuccinate lyase